MSEKISRETLSHKDKEMIEDILKKTPQELSDQDKKVLVARRPYLTSVEEEIFKVVFEGEVVELTDLKKPALEAMCVEKGIDAEVIKKAKNKAELIALLEGVEEEK